MGNTFLTTCTCDEPINYEREIKRASIEIQKQLVNNLTEGVNEFCLGSKRDNLLKLITENEIYICFDDN